MNDFLKTVKGTTLRTLVKHHNSYPKWYVNTGNYVLNLQVSAKLDGGFAGRAIWHLAGEESTGKTRIWVQCMKSFLSEDKERIGVIISTENEQDIDNELLDLYGDRIIIIANNDIHSVETELLNLFNRIEEQDPNESDTRTMVVLDSWGFLVLAKAVEKAIDGKQPNMDLLGVKMKNEFAVKMAYKPLLTNSIFFITNHVYIPPTEFATAKISGGKKVAHVAQCTFILTKIKAEKKERSDKIMMKVETRKGRNPMKEGTITVIPMEYYKGGLTLFGGLLEHCLTLGIIKAVSKGSSWYLWSDANEKSTKFQKKPINDDPEKFFTKERLEYIEKETRKVFCYSK